jgi:protease-4
MIALAAVMTAALAGCTRMRFVVDAVPPEETLQETVVMTDATPGPFGRPSKVAMVDVKGLLADARRNQFISDGQNPVDRFAEALQRAEADAGVKAVIVRINSPGGTVTASDIMYRELMRFKERSGKPVVVLMSSVAASGGYYLACGGDELIAHPTTITGSVGVIMQLMNFSEGMHRIGIRADAITSGQNKAMGSPFEPMPAEQRELFQTMVDEFYGNFAVVVEEARPDMPEYAMAKVRDGRVVTGRQALELGLIDRLGDVHDAFEAAKTRAGLERAELVKYHHPLVHVASPYASTPVAGTEVNLVQLNLAGALSSSPAEFLYLWDPSVW